MCVCVLGPTDIFMCHCTCLFVPVCPYISVHLYVSVGAPFCQCKAKYLIAIIGCAQEDASKTPNQELADTFDVELAVAVEMLANDRNSCTSTCKGCCRQMCLSHNIIIIAINAMCIIIFITIFSQAPPTKPCFMPFVALSATPTSNQTSNLLIF